MLVVYDDFERDEVPVSYFFRGPTNSQRERALGKVRAVSCRMTDTPRMIFALLLVLAGCGDETFDPDAVEISGTWSTRVENIGEPSGNDGTIVCTATWTMEIVESGGDEVTASFSSEVPLDARIECTDGYSSLFAHRGLDLVVLRDGATVSFVTASRMEPFATTTLVSGNRLDGRMSELYYGGGDLTATR